MKLSFRKNKIIDKKRQALQMLPTGVEVVKNVPYIRDNRKEHLLDIYRPIERKTRLLSIIINIHGGAWMYGNKELNKNYGMWLAQQGFLVVNINYRLFPKANLKGQIQDVFRAFHWIGKYAERYCGDTDEVYLMGNSVGGHLAGVAVCAAKDEVIGKVYGVKAPPFEIRALVLSHGMTDLTMIYDAHNLMDKEIRRMMFGRKYESAEWYGLAELCEILEDIQQRNESINKEFPSILLISSVQDKCHDQSVKMKNFLRENDFRGESIFWEEDTEKTLGHIFSVLYPQWEESISTNEMVVDFLESNR